MRQSEFHLLYAYLLNNEIQLEETVMQLQTNLRYRKIDVTDCMELACCIERLNTFRQVSKDIRSLLKIYDRKAKEYEKAKFQESNENP